MLPLCGVPFVCFFASAVYPAIWPFWGMAQFGWSEAMVGLTVAAFGLIVALFLGWGIGPAAARFGEWWVCLAGLVVAVVALGYGFGGWLRVVLVLATLHGPEGFVHPMLLGMMRNANRGAAYRR